MNYNTGITETVTLILKFNKHRMKVMQGIIKRTHMEEVALKTIVYNIQLVQFEEVFHDEGCEYGKRYTTILTFNNQILDIQLYFSQFF